MHENSQDNSWQLAKPQFTPRRREMLLGVFGSLKRDALRRIECHLYAVFEGLIRAKYSGASAKADDLEAVNLELEMLRLLCRLADELAILPHRPHEYASRELNEIGKMVGGWLRHQRRNKPSSNA